MRIYFDTNIAGRFLRENPGNLSRFKALRSRGISYYCSTDAITELVLNESKAGLLEQIRLLEQLVPDQNIYQAPKELFIAELADLRQEMPRSRLVPGFVHRATMKVIIASHGSSEWRDQKKKHIADAKEFWKFDDYSREQMEVEFQKIRPGMPPRFSSWWQKHLSDGTLEKTFSKGQLQYGISADETKGLLMGGRRYPAHYLQFLTLRLFPYSRIMKLVPSNKGDSVDLRHTISASYCDVFVTYDKNLRELLKAADDMLPYAVHSPDEFLEKFES